MAKKKTAPKKRGAPEKECPKCGTKVHVRVGECPQCHYQFPAKAASAAKKKPGRPAKVDDPLAAMNDAVAVIKEMGGLEEAKKLIEAAKAVQPVIERLGGLDKAAAVIASLENLKKL